MMRHMRMRSKSISPQGSHCICSDVRAIEKIAQNATFNCNQIGERKQEKATNKAEGRACRPFFCCWFIFHKRALTATTPPWPAEAADNEPGAAAEAALLGEIMPLRRSRMVSSASATMRSMSSAHVGRSWMSPTTCPAVQIPPSGSPVACERISTQRK